MTSSPLTLVSLLEHAGTLFPDTEILSQRSDNTTHRYTYADFSRRARALAAALQECGLRHSDRVATLMSNHHIQLEAYFGVPVAGGILHTLNPQLPADELAHIINHAEDRFLIVDDVLVPAFERIKGRVNVERVIVAPFKGGSSCHRYEEYEDLLYDCNGEPSYTGRGEVDPLHADSISRAHDLSVGHGDTILPAVPMFHERGWALPYAAILRGSRLILPGPHLQPERVLDLLSTHHVTLISADLTMWFGVLEALEHQPHRWTLVPGTRIVVGGAVAAASLVQRFDVHGLRVIQPRAIGSTTILIPQPPHSSCSWPIN